MFAFPEDFLRFYSKCMLFLRFFNGLGRPGRPAALAALAVLAAQPPQPLKIAQGGLPEQ